MSSIGPRRLLFVATLTLMWCGLWGRVSFANVASGVAVSALATLPMIATPARGTINLVALTKLLSVVFIDLLQSTATVAIEILTRKDKTDEAIIEIDLPRSASDHHLLLVVAVTLTPGTGVVDFDVGRSRIVLHLLHNSRRKETIAHVERLAALASEALPAPAVATR